MRYKNNTQCDILTEIPSIAVKLLNHLFKIKFCFSLLLMTRTIGKTTLTSFNMLDFASVNVSVNKHSNNRDMALNVYVTDTSLCIDAINKLLPLHV